MACKCNIYDAICSIAIGLFIAYLFKRTNMTNKTILLKKQQQQ